MPNPYIVAFIGGGCDGEYLNTSGEGVTRTRGNAKPFLSRKSASAYMTDYKLLGLNRPRRAVQLEPMRTAPPQSP